MSRHAFGLITLLFAGLVFAKFDAHTGFTSLIRFGDQWQTRRLPATRPLPLDTVPHSAGYDGQFYAQLALDPLLRDTHLTDAIDAPAYRARRILTPATASILGAGNPWLTLNAYALLNVVCWFAFAWLLRDMLPDQGWLGFARWAGCVLSLGVLDSVRQSLVDLPAMLLLLLAMRSQSRTSSTLRPALWLSLASLAKETSLLAALATLLAPQVDCAQKIRRVLLFVLAALPLALWSLYVASRFSSAVDSSGLGNFTWPLIGLFGQLALSTRELLDGNLDGRHSFAILAIAGLAVQATVLWRRPQWSSSWWRIGAAYSLLFLFLGPWVWSGYWAACRAVLPLTIAFNFLLPANRSFWPLWIVGNLTLFHAVWRFL